MMRLACLTAVGVLAAAPALAWDGVQVQEAEGHLQQHLWVAPSPTPGTCYWDHLPAAGPVFSASNSDGTGTLGCPDPWFVHCDGDSLVFAGTWPVNGETYVTGSEYVVDLACEVQVTAPTRLAAGGAVTSGDLDVDERTLTITYPDASTEQLLTGGAGGDEVVRTLQPGVHRVVLHVRAYQHKIGDEIIDAYVGRVWLRWEDPAVVTGEPVSWGALKAMYGR